MAKMDAFDIGNGIGWVTFIQLVFGIHNMISIRNMITEIFSCY